MSAQRRLSDTEREQRRQHDRERLKQAAEQLLTSDGWQRWVRVRAQGGLARLSLNNQLLVALAQPEATFVAGFRAWQRLGYCVRKGETAIRIIAPMPLKPHATEPGDGEEERRVLFKGVPVFDRSQVAPIKGVDQTPLELPCEPLTGDSHAHLLRPLCELAGDLGYTASFDYIDGATGGWCDAHAKRIVIDSGQAMNGQVRVLVHEIVHALGVTYQTHTRPQAEVIVDTATLIILSGAGLDTSGETIPYIAGWGETGALQAVTEHAELIDRLARTVEEAIATDANDGEAEAESPVSTGA